MHAPRIGVAQLLVWFGITTALVALDAAMYTARWLNLADILHVYVVTPWWNPGIRLLSIVTFSSCLVGVVVLIRSYRMQASRRLQPGHWIILSLALGGALAVATKPLELVALYLGWGFSAVYARRWFNLLAVGMFYCFAAFRLRNATRWKVLFGFLSANSILGAIAFFAMEYYTSVCMRFYPWFLLSWLAILLALALVVLVFDWRQRTARDWVHWLGVSLWGFENLAVLLFLLAAVLHLDVFTGPPKRTMMVGNPGAFQAKRPAHKWINWKAEDFFTDHGVISLCRAIEAHDLREIEQLVKSGVDVNVKGRGNMTPLMFAFPLGEDVLKKLLELKADPNVRLTERAWPILFEKGTSVMSAAASGTVTTPGPMHESYFGNVPMDNYLKIVLKYSGNPNIIVEDSSRETPLFTIGGDPATVRERIRQLVDAGADLNHRNYLGRTPLMLSRVSASNYVLSLLKAGADYRLAANTGSDAILIFERQTMDLERRLRERPNDAWVQSDLSAAKPVRDWLANEGVNWQAARAALESHVDFKYLPTDYKHRPWLPQRPTLKKPESEIDNN